MAELKVSIVGGSGYAGGELLRLLLFHPEVEIAQVTSRRYAGKRVGTVHPNLRKLNNGRPLVFSAPAELEDCDFLFLALPHGEAMAGMGVFRERAPRIIDLSGDFRLNDAEAYRRWYGREHVCPELLETFVYGIPELHRGAMREARYVSSAGCNATAVILPLYPFYKNDLVETDRTVVEVKVGTSEGGASVSLGSHHPVRSGSVRSYRPSGHRHTAEMVQELGFGRPLDIHFSATSIDMVRGIHAVCHVFLKEDLDEKAIWKIFREAYGGEPFVRIVKEREGLYRYPDPKLLAGTNYCDIGFERDLKSNRLVVFSAIDNLMKGAAGQAMQAFNIMNGFNETVGLEFPGLHPF